VSDTDPGSGTDPGSDLDTDLGLAPGLRLLWEPPATPRRGPKPTVTRERILAAAAEIADADGLAAVSMSRVGEALGVTAMALYRHVAGKDDLLLLLADWVAGELEPVPDGLGWREGLELWVRRQVEGCLRHPWVLDLPLSTAPFGPRRARWLEQGLAMMAELPLTAPERFRFLGLLAQHVLGEVRVQRENAATTDPFLGFATAIEAYAGADELPELRAAFAAAEPPYDVPDDDDDDTGFGIRVLLDGLEAYVERRRAARRSPGGRRTPRGRAAESTA